MDAYMGSMMLFAGNYAPHSWMECDGQRMMIAQNQALFSILGTTYGGDGLESYMLPDMRKQSLPAGLRWIICVAGPYPPRP
jgi:microcystin-dependent protein